MTRFEPGQLNYGEDNDGWYVEDIGGQIAFGLSPENAALFAAAPKLLEVVLAMASFDGRNNNKHLKDMAIEALKEATNID